MWTSFLRCFKSSQADKLLFAFLTVTYPQQLTVYVQYLPVQTTFAESSQSLSAYFFEGQVRIGAPCVCRNLQRQTLLQHVCATCGNLVAWPTIKPSFPVDEQSVSLSTLTIFSILLHALTSDNEASTNVMTYIFLCLVELLLNFRSGF